jgi:parallel beta-helix repeat protein
MANDLIISCSATNNILYVDSSNTQGPWNGTTQHPYQKIQDAIDSALDETTISIAAGTYFENIVIQKNLVLLGEDRDTTIIDGGKNGDVIKIQGSAGNQLSLQFSSISVRNAGGLGYDCLALSYITSGSITDSIFMNSDQSDGIQLDHCTDLTIANNQIINNKGAGISLTLSSTNIISNNIIHNNQKGIYFYLNSNNNNANTNQISSNTQYGVYIVQSNTNIFYKNDLNDNGQNAQDTSSNIWSYSGEGNYWDDYNDYDENPNDGIGDTPYTIPGGTNEDAYPLGYFIENNPPQSGNTIPIAYIPTIYPTPADSDEEITFSGGGTDADGYIVAYYWRSSIDGFISDKATFTSTELSPGAHTIFFKVRDNDGEWSTEKSTTLQINDINNADPSATIIYVKPSQIAFREIIYFSGIGVDTDGTIIAYNWESNIDGVIGTTKAFNSNLLSPGTHSISFKVQDDQQKWSPIVKTSVTIVNTANSSEILVHTGGPYLRDTFKVSFDASNSIGGTDFFWDFGDGSYGTGVETSYTYTEIGNYSVKLTIQNDEGEIASATTYVNISEAALVKDSPQGLESLSFALPLSIIILIQLIIVIGCIGFFFFWMKHK